MKPLTERLDLEACHPDDLRVGARAMFEIYREVPANGDASIRKDVVAQICRALEGAGLGIRRSTGMKPGEITALFTSQELAA